jgi:lipopolysaccharide transport system permease protein
MTILPPTRPARNGSLDAISREAAAAHDVLVLEPARGWSRQHAAWRDVRDGLRLWRLALTLGWLDVKLRYRGSILGPFWLTLSTAVMVGALGVVWGTLFHMSVRQYLPFLGLSLVLWSAGISQLASDACITFTQADGTIRSVRMPFTVHVLRTLARNVIGMAHNVVVPIGVFAIYDTWPGLAAAWCLPGLALWLLDGAATCALLGAFSARFRDIPPIVGSIMQIAFYVTPIVWKPSQLGDRHHWWVTLNPFDAMLEVVRQPLLGIVPSGETWGLAAFWSAVLCGAAWLLFARARGRLAFWV